MFNIKLFELYNKTFVVRNGRTNGKLARIFMYSISIGIILSIFSMYIGTENPFLIFKEGIPKFFDDPIVKNSLFRTMSYFALAGVSVGVGFKTGLFNIGVSGQLMVSGFTTFAIAIKLGDVFPHGIGQIFIVITSIIIGALYGAIAGALKSYFNIHEVVSTILLNWIALYYMQWLLDANTSTLLNPANPSSSKTLADTYLLHVGGFVWIPAVILTVIVVFFSWFVLNKTSFGRQLIIVGKNPNAAEYSGINRKLIGVSSMAFSGGIAGVLGALIYFGASEFNVPFRTSMIPDEGFDGIAIALIAFSNPLLILPVALFFASFREAIQSTLYLSPVFIQFAFGILMYTSAIGPLFETFNFGNLYARIKYKDSVYEWEKLKNDISIRKEKLISLLEVEKSKETALMAFAKYKEDVATLKSNFNSDLQGKVVDNVNK